VIGKSSIPDGRSFARDLAIAIEPRGPHATGFAWTEKGWPYTWKSPGRPTVVARQAPLPTGMTVALVHARYATLGDPAHNENNHPIVAPGLVLIHNGVVSNHRRVLDDLGAEPEGVVDSAAIAHLLAEGPDVYGIEEPWKLLPRIEGDAAIAWLDESTGDDLHLARLVGRPLTIGWTRRNDLVFSSTPQTLRAAAYMADVAVENVREIAENTYLRVRAGQIIERESFAPKLVRKSRPVRRGYAHGITDRFGSGGPQVIELARGRAYWSTAEQRWIGE
jgi:glucosamine 6-phosphate synthetase-like amidotransferase/phosphosugar isomerase protein